MMNLELTIKDETKESINRLENELNLPIDFLEQLTITDDWSFIIKLHSLMEAAITYLLVHHFNDDRLKKVFDKLDFNQNCRFVSELNLLPKECRNFLAKLSSMRNIAAHDITNVTFNLKAHVLEMDGQQFKEYKKNFVSLDLSKIDLKNREKEWVAENAKKLILRYSVITLELIYLKKRVAEDLKTINELKIQIADNS